MTAQAHAETVVANNRLFRKLAIIALGMFGFGFALVPFYETICEVTGIRNVFQPDEVVARNTQVDMSRSVGIEFDSNTQRLPWTFKPLERNVQVHPGQVVQVIYEVRNNLDRAVTGQAIPGYAPALSMQYFKKLECFCFRQTTLAPGEVRQMPVVFVIDPELPKDVNTITLSYTFFEVVGAAKKAG